MEKIIVKKTQRGRLKLYDVEEIGRRRMDELKLRTGKTIFVSIDVSYLGACSIKNVPIIIALVTIGNGLKIWKILQYSKDNIRRYWGHCYVMRGKKIKHVGGHCYGSTIEEALLKYEEEETGKPMCMQRADEIFYDGIGRKCVKKPHISGSRKPTANGTPGTVRDTMITRRFSGSRITCVYKTKRI